MQEYQTADESFHEEQSFDQWWVRLLVWGIAGLMAAVFGTGMYIQFVEGRPWGDNPMSDTGLAIVGPVAILFSLALALFLSRLRLITSVRSDGVHLNFVYMKKKFIPFSDIERCEAVEYHPIRDFGGWGIRYGGKHGWAYNVKGNRGVSLHLSGGARFLVGSQRDAELAEAISGRL